MDKILQHLPMGFFKLLTDPLPLVNLIRLEVDAVQGALDRNTAVLAAADAADQPAQSRTGPLPFSLMTVDAFGHATDPLNRGPLRQVGTQFIAL